MTSQERLRAYATVSWRLLVCAAAIGVVLFVALALRVVVIGLLFGLILAALLSPVQTGLRKLRVPRSLAAGICLLLAVGLVAGAVALAAIALVDQWEFVTAEIDDAVTRIRDWIGNQTDDGAFEDVEAQVVSILQRGAERALPATFDVVNVLALALIAAFFFIRDNRDLFGRFAATMPADLRPAITRAGVAGWATFSGYVRGITIVALTDALLIGFGLWIIGVPSAGTIGVLTFFAGYVPFFGAVTAGAVGVLLAFADGGLGLALIALAIIVGVQQLEGNVLEPVVVGRSVDLHPLVLIVVLITGGIVAGFVGLVLAVPIAAVTASVLRTLRNEPAPLSERVAGEQGAVASDLAEPAEPEPDEA